MNDRYVYGYGEGWNVENEYIQGITQLLDEYNKQLNILQQTISPRRFREDYTDEELKQMYVNDEITMPFEDYKSTMLTNVGAKNADVYREYQHITDIYNANLYHMIEVKNETRKNIYQKRRELELELEESRLELARVSLEQKKTQILYDDDHTVMNSEELDNLRKNYDAVWLKIRKIEHALQQLEKMRETVEFTREEEELMLRGLNPRERKIYNELNKSVVSSNRATQDLTGDEASEDDLTDDEISEDDLTDDEISEDDLTDDDISEDDLTDDDTSEDDLTDDDELGFDDDEPKRPLHLQGIIDKVLSESFTGNQSSKYRATKIKVFTLPQNLKRKGNLYKVFGLFKATLGILPNALMKLRGKSMKSEHDVKFRRMEEAAANLTDEEVEYLLKHYANFIATNERPDPAFETLVTPRINKYIAVKIRDMNLRLEDLYKTVDFFGQLIKGLEEKLEEERETLTPEQISVRQDQIDRAYGEAAKGIREISSIYDRVGEIDGYGAHAFGETSKAVGTGFNYKGGRFGRAKGNDAELRKERADIQDLIRSEDPKDVVKGYFANEQNLAENTKTRRSLLNLGSRISVGDLDNRHFIETMDYSDDTLVSDIITTILVVSSISTLVKNVAQNIKNIRAINDANRTMDATNSTGMAQQDYIDGVRSKSSTVTQGLKEGTFENYGSADNLAERVNNQRHGFKFDSSYTADDTAIHANSSQLISEARSEIESLEQSFSAGTISETDYIRRLNDICQDSYMELTNTIADSQDVISSYQAVNPGFDWSALQHFQSLDPSRMSEAVNALTNNLAESMSLQNFMSMAQLDPTAFTTNLSLETLTSVAALSRAVSSLSKKDSKKSQDLTDEQKDIEKKMSEGELTDSEEVRAAIEEIISRTR